MTEISNIQEQEREPKKYIYTLRNKFICIDHSTIEEFRDTYKHYMILMQQWMTDGIKILDNGGVGDDYATFYTTDPVIAERFGFERDLFEEEMDDIIENIEIESDKENEEKENI